MGETTSLYKKEKGKNNGVEEEDFISDPLLGALLNEKDEIIVNDTIYKFSRRKGIFFSHVKDSASLFKAYDKMMKKDNKNSSLLKAAPVELEYQYCQERSVNGGVRRISDEAFVYVAPAELDACESNNLYVKPVTTPTTPQLSDEEKLYNLVNNMTACDESTPFMQNILGRTFVCRNYFDNRRRIKTEFWSQDYFFYQSVGVQAKTQTKTLGVWWASESDELVLGINRILLRYNLPQPEINSYSHPNLFPPNSYQSPIYMWDGRFKVDVSTSTGGTYFVDTKLNLPDGALPFFKFGEKEILNIYIPRLNQISGLENGVSLSSKDIINNRTIKQLYKMGIDFLNSPNVANSGGAKKEFSVIYQYDYNRIEVIYFGEVYRKSNSNYIKKTLYNSGINFEISAAWGDVSGWSYNLKPVTKYFRNYTYFDLDFYAVARRGSTWKGSRIVVKE
ncbi:hypothetical protein [Pseudotamlana carrageenivorans]|uniref:Uncharacterized protein n=1 Tax=Pseudotamlana carrageenivorans TaxID=2069432 RepID=A0A2I7SH98_9FLAO|nr:hypothetical protein [Tamlana carrageenivorans]AUS05269.1 hypothetical protein C1A40_07180 [Tamlana carrageenivorans]